METLKQTQESDTVLNLKSRIAELQEKLKKEEASINQSQFGNSPSRVLAPSTPSPSKVL